MENLNDNIISKQIANELNIKIAQVNSTISLLDEKNTVPFIARYRKEVTGNLDDQLIRVLSEKLQFYRNLYAKKEEIKKLIAKQELLNDELLKRIDNAQTINELDDLYRPFRPKRKTRASIAMQKGLTPLAMKIVCGNTSDEDISVFVNKYIDPSKDLNTENEVISGAMDIIAEYINDDAILRKKLKNIIFNTGILTTKSKKKGKSPYEMYYDYNEPVTNIAGHRVLAINRAENEDFLSVKISVDNDYTENIIFEYIKSGTLIKNIQTNKRDIKNIPINANFSHNIIKIIQDTCKDSWKRLVFPSLEKEIRNHLTEQASNQAIDIFSKNLYSTLMQPPVKSKTILGFDPAYRTGCKLAVISSTGKCLNTSVIYPTLPQNRIDESKKALLKLIKQYKIDIIAIGNGTASGESEKFISDFINEYKLDIVYTIVNEAGASVYSASELGAKEFPEFDVSLRSAISIARRLQDPLAELVKIEPSSIGVGQYQHDMNQTKLKDSLSAVVENCVNTVGVDLNTASPSLLSYISGLNSQISINIVNYRDEIGEFTSRTQLKNIPKLGAKTFEQCAGFLRIPNSKERLDNTSVHPESYKVAKAMIKLLNNPKNEQINEISNSYGVNELADKLQIGKLTLIDIIDSISKPGRDPRGDDYDTLSQNKPIDIKELNEGMILTGTVRNVVAFGAFVDIGVHQDGLVHISEISDKYIKSPTEVLSAGQKVKVRIISIDIDNKRISLSMKNISQ